MAKKLVAEYLWTVIPYNNSILNSGYHAREGAMYPFAVYLNKRMAEFGANFFSDGMNHEPSIDTFFDGYRAVPFPYTVHEKDP